MTDRNRQRRPGEGNGWNGLPDRLGPDDSASHQTCRQNGNSVGRRTERPNDK
jgi:hypothetical protein